MSAKAAKNPHPHPDDEARPLERTLAEGSGREPDEPVEEVKLPPRNPTRGRGIEDPNPKRKNRLDDEIDGADEDDDATGEMDAAGQDLGLVADEEHQGRAANVGRGAGVEETGGGRGAGMGQFD